MTLEQRKLELIAWITDTQSEEVINRMEAFRNAPEHNPTNTLLELLNESNSAKLEDCIEHTSVRELLGRK